MPGKIFINYRRDDDAGFTQALYQRLEEEFTLDALFMDVEGHIKPGDDFVHVLSQQVASCDVFLAVIGLRWSDLMMARADRGGDFVVIEIKAAIDQGKRVIPVLVGGASMPRGETLPEPIQQLARRNAVGLRPDRFKADCQGLIRALKEQLAAAEHERIARTEAERLRREAEDAERLKAAEQRAREQAVAGLSPEDIRKAEELANWEFIKERADAQALRNHLARFPTGVTALYASTKLEEVVWTDLGLSADIASLKAFNDEFPKGKYAEAARTRLTSLEVLASEAEAAQLLSAAETGGWAAVAASADQAAIKAFLAKWPTGKHTKAARARLNELRGTPTRRWLLQGAGAAGGSAAIAGGLYAYTQRDQSIRTLKGTAPVRAIAISRDGRMALSAARHVSNDERGYLEVWDIQSGRVLRTLCCQRDITCVAVSPEGRWALSAGYADRKGNERNAVKLWDIETGRQLPTFAGHTLWVNSVALSADGKTALSGGGGRELFLWEVESGRQLQSFKGTSSYDIFSVALASDGKHALSSRTDDKLVLWDVATGDERRSWKTSTWARSIAFSPDGTAILATAGERINLYDVEDGGLRRTFEADSGNFLAAAFSPDGKRILTGGYDRTLKMWDVASGRLLSSFKGHANSIISVAFMPGGKMALSGSLDETLKIWQISN